MILQIKAAMCTVEVPQGKASSELSRTKGTLEKV